jgi:hypothetical protein
MHFIQTIALASAAFVGFAHAFPAAAPAPDVVLPNILAVREFLEGRQACCKCRLGANGSYECGGCCA